jgi:hypothetical protein
MNGLRDTVLNLLQSDPAMNGYGYGPKNLYPAFGRDAPPEGVEGQQFGVVKWGTSEPGLGRVNAVVMEIWLYNREPDFVPIGCALFRARAIMDALTARQVQVNPPGWVLGVRWDGAGTDGWDDLYKAVLRSESYTITASGN